MLIYNGIMILPWIIYLNKHLFNNHQVILFTQFQIGMGNLTMVSVVDWPSEYITFPLMPRVLSILF